MYKSGPNIKHRRQNANKKKALVIIGLCITIIVCFVILKLTYKRQNITLQGTWQSEETGQILTFTSDGNVDIKGNLSNGIYHIISPNTMEYTVDGKTFQMIYHIEDRKLYWGLDEMSLESFQLISCLFCHLI